MRPGGVPTVTGQDHSHPVAATGDGADSNANRPDGLARVAVQREDPVDALKNAGVYGVDRLGIDSSAAWKTSLNPSTEIVVLAR